jgi:hypothetical protein
MRQRYLGIPAHERVSTRLDFAGDLKGGATGEEKDESQNIKCELRSFDFRKMQFEICDLHCALSSIITSL